MEDKGIDEAMDAAVEDDMIKDALGLSLPPEVVVEGYKAMKAFDRFSKAAEGTGDTKTMDAMMCVLVDRAIYRTDEIDIERMKKVKFAWMTIRNYLQPCGNCKDTEHKACL